MAQGSNLDWLNEFQGQSRDIGNRAFGEALGRAMAVRRLQEQGQATGQSPVASRQSPVPSVTSGPAAPATASGAPDFGKNLSDWAAGTASAALNSPVAQAIGGAWNHDDPIMGAIRGGAGFLGEALDVGNKYVTRPAGGQFLKWAADAGMLDDADKRAALQASMLTGPASMFAPLLANQSDEQVAAIRAGSGGTDAWDTRFADDPVGKFAYEAVFDPLNLVGVGIGGNLAKGASRGAQAIEASHPLLARLLQASGQTARVADTAAAAVQAAPLTVPLKGAKALAKATGIFADTAASRLAKDTRGLFQAGEAAGRDATGQMVSAASEAAASQLRLADDPQALAGTFNDYTLARVFNTEPDWRSTAAAELKDRGLLTATGDATPRLRTHLAVDDAALQHGLGTDTADSWHQTLDQYAEVISQADPAKYPTADAAFGDILVKPTFDAAAGIKGSFTRLPSGKFQVTLTPEADVTTLPHELMGHAASAAAREPAASVTRVAEEANAAAAEMAALNAGSPEYKRLADEAYVTGTPAAAAEAPAPAVPPSPPSAAPAVADILTAAPNAAPEAALTPPPGPRAPDAASPAAPAPSAPPPDGVTATAAPPDVASIPAAFSPEVTPPAPATGIPGVSVAPANNAKPEVAAWQWFVDNSLPTEKSPALVAYVEQQLAKRGGRALSKKTDHLLDYTREDVMGAISLAAAGGIDNPAYRELSRLARGANYLQRLTPWGEPTFYGAEAQREARRQAMLEGKGQATIEARNTPTQADTEFYQSAPTGPSAALSGSPADVTFPQVRAASSNADVVNKIAAENSLPSAGIEPTVKLLDQLEAKNPAQLQPAMLTYGASRDALARVIAAPDDASRLVAFRDLAAEMNARWAGFGVEHPLLQRILDVANPASLRTSPTPAAAGRSGFGSAAPDAANRRIADALANPEVQKAVAKYEALEDKVRGAAQAVGVVLGDFSTLEDVAKLRDMAGLGDADKAAIEEYLKLSGGLGEKGTLRQAWSSTLASKWADEAAAGYGVNPNNRPPGIFVQKLLLLRSAWTGQALVSPRYHMANTLDMAFKSAVHGYTPLIGQSAQTVAEKWGIAPPLSVTDPRKLRELVGKGVTTDEYLSATDTPAIAQLLPNKLGRGLGKVEQTNRHIAQAIETSFRMWAWAGETRKQLTEFLPTFMEEARRTLDAPVAAALEGTLKPLGVDVGQKEVTAMASAAGATPEQAATLGAGWSRAVLDASRKGEDAANLVHFDPLSQSKLEAKLGMRWWAPFHFWAMRNLPYYAQTLAQNPYLLRAWTSYNDLSAEEKRQANLPARFDGMLPLGKDTFLNAILGPGQAYFNPLVVMSLADQFRMTGQDPNATLLGRGLRAIGPLGLRPAPWVDIPLVALGVYGPNQEPGNVLRHTGLASAAISAATGQPVDVEGPVKGAVRAIQRAPAPVSDATLAGIPIGGGDYLDYLVSKRLAELSVEETGLPGNPAYTAAMANPRDTLYQRALRDVLPRQFWQQAYGFASSVPAKVLPDTEAAVRLRLAETTADKAMLDPATTKQYNRSLGQTNDLATTYWSANSDPRLAQVSAGLAALQGVPSGGIGVAARADAMERFPLLRAYLNWQATLPRNVDRSPAAFIKTQN